MLGVATISQEIWDLLLMNEGPVPGRPGAIIMAVAILGAPFIAMLFRIEAGLVVMAVALGAGSLLLREALEAVPIRARRLLRLAILANLTLAVVCVSVAAWLVLKR